MGAAELGWLSGDPWLARPSPGCGGSVGRLQAPGESHTPEHGGSDGGTRPGTLLPASPRTRRHPPAQPHPAQCAAPSQAEQSGAKPRPAPPWRWAVLGLPWGMLGPHPRSEHRIFLRRLCRAPHATRTSEVKQKKNHTPLTSTRKLQLLKYHLEMSRALCLFPFHMNTSVSHRTGTFQLLQPPPGPG